MPKGTIGRKRAAQQVFAEMMAEGVTPESLMVALMRGKVTIDVDGKEIEITARMESAARDLLRYRLPALNAIDAEVTNVTMTHEQWLASLTDE